MKTENKRLTREEFEILLGRFMHLETLKPVDLWNWIEQYADQKARESQIEVLEDILSKDPANPVYIRTIEEKIKDLKFNQ